MGSSSPNKKPTKVTSRADFMNKINSQENANKLIVAEFGTEYNPYCQLIEPAINHFAEKYHPVVEFLKVDCEDLGDLARFYRVRGYPTFILMKKGRAVTRVRGGGEAELERLIEKNKPAN